MGRALNVGEQGLVVRYNGLDRLATLVSELVLPRELIESAGVGLEDAPSVWTSFRVGMAVPIRNTRRGRFWQDGRRLFLDLSDPSRALVVRMKPGARFDVVAIETPDAERLAAELAPGG